MDKILHTAQLPGRVLSADDAEYLYFSGTSYLGMAGNAAFQEYLREGMARYGTNYSSSRLSNVQLAVFAEAEEYLANYTGAEAALTVSSGFLAGQLVVRSLAGKGTFLYGPRTHPALWLAPENFSNMSLAEWIKSLPEKIQNIPDWEPIYILCNSLDPLWAQPYYFNWVKDLPAAKNITLIIDDSHGLGVTGERGAGIFAAVKALTNLPLVVVSSLGKALGIPGGVILGNQDAIRLFKRSPFLGGGSPVVPAYLYAFLRAEKLYDEARAKLARNIQDFLSRLNTPDLFQYLPDYPVFYTAHNPLYPFLLEQRILISSFPYPTPHDANITRVVLNSLHTETDLNSLTTQLNAYSRQEKIE